MTVDPRTGVIQRSTTSSASYILHQHLQRLSPLHLTDTESLHGKKQSNN